MSQTRNRGWSVDSGSPLTPTYSPENSPRKSSDDPRPQPISTSMHHQIFHQPFGTTWRKALVSLPRAVPDVVFKFTAPNGPHPISIKIPSRDKSRNIHLYVFLPPSVTHAATPFNPITSTHLRTCPVLIDFHGGGFCIGSCQEQIPFCAKMSRDLNCISISVDYRLGPSSRFPAAFHDAEDVVNAILRPLRPGYHELRNHINNHLTKAHRPRIELDVTHVALSGFSSGGSLAYNLSMSVSSQPDHIQLDTDWPSPFEFDQLSFHPIPILLFYPALDTRLLPHERPLPPSMHQAPKSFLASLNLEAELMPTYLPKHLTTHPRASPGLVNTSTSDDNPPPASENNPTNTTASSHPPPLPPRTHPSALPKITTGTGTLHPKAKYLVILPELDTLSFSNETWISKMNREGRGNDIQIERVKDVLHGWTQFPDTWLNDSQRKKKTVVFEKAVEFIRGVWGIEDENGSGRVEHDKKKSGKGGAISDTGNDDKDNTIQPVNQ